MIDNTAREIEQFAQTSGSFAWFFRNQNMCSAWERRLWNRNKMFQVRMLIEGKHNYSCLCSEFLLEVGTCDLKWEASAMADAHRNWTLISWNACIMPNTARKGIPNSKLVGTLSLNVSVPLFFFLKILNTFMSSEKATDN